MKKLQKMIMICLLIIGCICQPVSASTPKKGSISISYPCEGMKVDLYEVAQQGADSNYVLKDRLKKYPIKLNQQTKAEWAGQAQALTAYIHRDNLSADYSTTTDSTGNVHFKNLKKGIYLVMVQTFEKDGYVYKVMPYFLTIPGKTEDGKLQYNITTTAKYEKTPSTDDKVDYKAAKTWSDQGHEKNRPKSITVQLLCDGNIYDEVKLSEKNNWQYTWKNLSSKHQWEAIEKKEARNYFVSVSKQSTSFVIKNIYWDDEHYQDSDKPGKKNTKTTEEYYQDSDKPKTTETTSKTKKLPQTGQLWWPLPFLAAGGILCISIGMIKKKRENNETK